MLTTVGLYAVTARAVSLRQHELGIRMAFGATPARIARLVVAGVRLPLLLGLGLGLAGAMAWDRAFPSGQPRLRASDPRILAIVGLVLVLVAVVACYRPARRAARLAPAEELRQG
ncbi:MAG: FtsX-like permease family protein [Vicinamibacterales bacterium]